MNKLNRQWVALIIIGILFFLFTIVWDTLNLSNSNNSEINTNTNPLPSQTLFSKKLEDHLNQTL